MIPLALGSQAYDSTVSGLPPERCVNMVPEQVESDQPGYPYVLIPTQGVERIATAAGSGRGIWHQRNAVGGDALVVHGGTVSTLSADYTLTGRGSMAVDSDLARFAATRTAVLISAGGELRIWNGTALSTTGLPGGVAAGDVVELNGRWIVAAQNSQAMYYSGIADPASWNGLSLLSASERPDDVVALIVVGEILHVLGRSTVERWVTTADSEAPYRPLVGSTVEAGCLARGTAQAFDNSVVWVGRDRVSTSPVVFRLAEGPQRISTTVIEEKLQDAMEANTLAQASARVFGDRGDVFYALDIPGAGTFVYGAKSGRWHERTTREANFWRCRDVTEFNGRTIAVGRDGDVWRLTRAVYTDNGEEVPRIVTANAPMQDGRPAVDNVVLRTSAGVGLDGAVQGSDPIVMMRFSDDRGRSWSNRLHRSAGKIGEFEKVVRWNRLGRTQPPGRTFEFSYSDPAPVVFHGGVVNAAHP